jgi:hypothetical protein
MVNRREVLTTAGAALLAASTKASAGPAGGSGPQPADRHPDLGRFPTLAGAMRAAGFDPHRSEAFTAVFTADIHYGTGAPDEILPPILGEVNRMDPRPAFFAVAGDLICKASLRFGDVPDERQREEALAEYRMVKEALAGLDARIPLKLTLGNHDTYPGEDVPRLFRTVFPEHPVYHAFTVKGVPFLFLNGGANGDPSYDQRTWYRERVQALHRPNGTLVTVIHQPSLGLLTKERGVTRVAREGLKDVTGDLWLIGGHEHRNATDCFRLPHGAVVSQATLTKGNPAVWGEPPGYWVWCFDRGRLVARIFRGVGQDGFTVAAPPPRDRAPLLALPFEDREQEVLWKVMVGEGDTPYLAEHKAAWCLNYWHYNQYLTYRFPLRLSPAAERLCVLETHDANAPFRCLVGPDAQQLAPVDLAERDGSYSYLEIPASCRTAGSVTVRLEGCVVAGFALTA